MSRRPERVLAIAVYPPSLAATRLRLEQYGPALREAGIELRLWTFFSADDIRGWFGPTHRGRAVALLRGLLRLPAAILAARGAAIVIVQREALPIGPALLELVLRRGRKLVWDVDDAVWESWPSPTVGSVPRWLRATAGKFEKLCRSADEVWAGSELLAAWCRARNGRVVVVPTVVDVPAERPPPPDQRVVGWIGSHSTCEFVAGVLPEIATITPPPRVLIVGASPPVPERLDVDLVDWSPEAEAIALATTRVGLYPVDPRHPLAEGKCGLKAILFMSHGVPLVVTPTTTNATIVRDGIEGLHAHHGEWGAVVARLLDDDVLREQMSRAAHERARSCYSLAVWAPCVVERVRSLLST